MVNGKCMVIVTLLGTIGAGLTLLADGSGDFASFIDWKDVCFPHEMHAAELEIECESCHHETNAARLKTPHAEYFEDFWIDCTTCHRAQGAPAASTSCSSCHHDSPRDVADESLSSKVVIHQSCWRCHEVGTAAEASRACNACHNGKHHHPIPEEGREESPGS